LQPTPTPDHESAPKKTWKASPSPQAPKEAKSERRVSGRDCLKDPLSLSRSLSLSLSLSLPLSLCLSLSLALSLSLSPKASQSIVLHALLAYHPGMARWMPRLPFTFPQLLLTFALFNGV